MGDRNLVRSFVGNFSASDWCGSLVFVCLCLVIVLSLSLSCLCLVKPTEPHHSFVVSWSCLCLSVSLSCLCLVKPREPHHSFVLSVSLSCLCLVFRVFRDRCLTHPVETSGVQPGSLFVLQIENANQFRVRPRFEKLHSNCPQTCQFPNFSAGR